MEEACAVVVQDGAEHGGKSSLLSYAVHPSTIDVCGIMEDERHLWCSNDYAIK